MNIKKELITREIAGEVILVPVGKSVLESNGLFALNELGTFLWKYLPAAESETALVDFVLEEYEVDRETAAADTAEFLQKLRNMDILE